MVSRMTAKLQACNGYSLAEFTDTDNNDDDTYCGNGDKGTDTKLEWTLKRYHFNNDNNNSNSVDYYERNATQRQTLC